ncbi:MAG TPA: RNA methyltransferase [bacterium]|nr:RNA methyltransferase [bacterium]
MKSFLSDVFLALVHYPVTNKRGEVVVSALTTLDVHDISRAAATYGVRGFYVVTPLEAHKELAARMCRHWIDGYGSTYNPLRGEALRYSHVVDTVEDAVAAAAREAEISPVVVATTARDVERPRLSYESLRRQLQESEGAYLLLFGTGWGLTEEILCRSDQVLAPICGPTSYNHLSVRSAVAITLDRLLGSRQKEKFCPGAE